MKALLAIDPGSCSGVALFYANVLVWAWGGSVHEIGRPPMGWGFAGSDFVIEIPQIYPGSQEEDPNDLVRTSITAGRWIERMCALGAREPVEVRPREWKGQVPKTIHNARVRARMTVGEISLLPDLPKSKMHNVIDAVGLGLWRLGRMGRGS